MKFHFYHTFIILLTLAVHSGLSGQLADNSLESYINRAQSANPGIKAFQQHYEAAKSRVPQVASLPDPMLQVTHFVESVQTRTGPQENILMLSQKIPWFGKLETSGKAASLQAESLWYAFQNQQLILTENVATAYFEYAYLGRAIELTRESHQLLTSLEPIVESKVRGGGELNSLLLLQVEAGKIADRVQSLQEKQAIQAASLRSLLALEPGYVLPVPEYQAPEPIEPDSSSMLVALEQNNPGLAMLQRRIESADARSELARLEKYPDISLGLNYIQIGSPSSGQMMTDAGKDPWGLSLSVNLPIWQKKNAAIQDQALHSKRAAEFEYENRMNNLKADLATAVSRLGDAQRRLALYGDELLTLAEQALKINRTSYEGGKTGILEVIESERSLLELQLQYWRAASEAWQQKIRLQTLTNQPVTTTILQ